MSAYVADISEEKISLHVININFASSLPPFRLGRFLADLYKKSSGSSFSASKFSKKLSNASLASHILAIVAFIDPNGKGREVEEICSVAMAVQNLHVMLSNVRVGAYWSSASVYDPKAVGETDLMTGTVARPRTVDNPEELREFLGLGDGEICLGWCFVGEWKGLGEGKKWPKSSRRRPKGERLLWRGGKGDEGK